VTERPSDEERAAFTARIVAKMRQDIARQGGIEAVAKNWRERSPADKQADEQEFRDTFYEAVNWSRVADGLAPLVDDGSSALDLDVLVAATAHRLRTREAADREARALEAVSEADIAAWMVALDAGLKEDPPREWAPLDRHSPIWLLGRLKAERILAHPQHEVEPLDEALAMSYLGSLSQQEHHDTLLRFEGKSAAGCALAVLVMVVATSALTVWNVFSGGPP
jgi:hypothetical protein